MEQQPVGAEPEGKQTPEKITSGAEPVNGAADLRVSEIQPDLDDQPALFPGLPFQDGDLLALGTNIFNLGVLPCYLGSLLSG